MRKIKLRNLDYFFIIKVALGSTLAVFTAKTLGLNYDTSAGIITLLTIQTTKKETLEVSMKRVFSFLIAMGLSGVLFWQLGFDTIVFGLFLLLFIILCKVFRLEVGITSNAVLVTHLLSQGMINFDIIWNEVLILVIGAGIGVSVNLIMPRKVKKIRVKQALIDERMKEILYHLSVEILEEGKEEEQKIFAFVDQEIERALILAREESYNSYDSNSEYYLKYIEMRKNQISILKNVHHHIHRLSTRPSQAVEVSELIKKISLSFHEYNNADILLGAFEKLILEFKEQKLPVTREEFENRAVLYQILHDFRYFLVLKNDFSYSLSKRQKELFWEKSDQNLD